METEPKGKILIIDDEDAVLRVLTAVLSRHGYLADTALNGIEGYRKAKEHQPDLVLMDIMMPGLDGFETCRMLKSMKETRSIPVVMLTSQADRDSKIRALQAGANDFLAKPVDYAELTVRVENLLKAKKYQDLLDSNGKILKSQVEERSRKLRGAMLETVHRMTLAAEYRDGDTYAHIKRTSHYTELVARKLGIPREDAEIMFYAAPMHDIGMVGVPDSIMLKPGRLTPGEIKIMKTHTTIGANILRGTESPFLVSAEKFALYHHERWDGSGYPHGLKGRAIPVEGRILGIIDQYDALRRPRPYKPAIDHETAKGIIVRGNGRTLPGRFDPEILDIFVRCSGEFADIYDRCRE